MNNINRRKFLQSTAALTALSGVKIARAGSGSASNQPIIIDLFMRGGMDGLNVVPPFSGPNRTFYEDLRQSLSVPLTGSNQVIDIGEDFGLHPAATGFRDMYLDGDLAIIQGVGLPVDDVTRSHFDAMKLIELGTPQSLTTTDGWLTRHLNTTPAINGSEIIPVLVSASSSPISLQSYFNALTIDQVSGYHPNSGRYQDQHAAAISAIYGGNSALDLSVGGAMNSLSIISELELDNYLPAGGVVYPENNSFSRQLALIAQLIRNDLNINVATADLGGWDTHDQQGDNGGGNFFNKVAEMSNAITALWQDLKAAGLGSQVTIVVHSEFGRRVRRNGQSNSGTDHGSGNVMFVIGGQVKGGQMYGTFRGLNPNPDAGDPPELFGGQDVWPEVDFRQVFATIVKEVLGNPNIGQVFPGYENHVSMDFVTPDLIFQAGFE
jgi:uncharacterized protein (DUF1501 family)